MKLQEKAQQLSLILQSYGSVALAFSGGVDSSFLLRYALEILGADRVLVLHARSCLQKSYEQAQVESWFSRHGIKSDVEQVIVELRPLDWEAFIRNPEDRCYLCKRHLYSLFIDEAEKRGRTRLIDGTNLDDRQSHRPGLRAISEFGVATPLADAGLRKEDVRLLSREFGLDTWNQPSSSCLATRIPHGLEVTRERIQRIAALEDYLAGLGFVGSRVRLDRHNADAVHVQLQEKDFTRFIHRIKQDTIIHFFYDSGLKDIYLDLRGRKL